MRHSMRSGLSHRDWFVQVIPCGPAFSFCCHHSSLGRHTNGAIYSTIEAAILAGCQFIDREQAVAALSQLFDEWVVTEKISVEEYWNLVNFSDDGN